MRISRATLAEHERLMRKEADLKQEAENLGLELDSLADSVRQAESEYRRANSARERFEREEMGMEE